MNTGYKASPLVSGGIRGAMYIEALLTDQRRDTTVIMKMSQNVKTGLKSTLRRAAAFIGKRLYPSVQTEWKNPLDFRYFGFTYCPRGASR